MHLGTTIKDGKRVLTTSSFISLQLHILLTVQDSHSPLYRCCTKVSYSNMAHQYIFGSFELSLLSLLSLFGSIYYIVEPLAIPDILKLPSCLSSFLTYALYYQTWSHITFGMCHYFPIFSGKRPRKGQGNGFEAIRSPSAPLRWMW